MSLEVLFSSFLFGDLFLSFLCFVYFELGEVILFDLVGKKDCFFCSFPQSGFCGMHSDGVSYPVCF